MRINLKLFFLIFSLSLAAFFINYYYASLGVLPIDTFAHFDSGFRVTQGEIPFVDYWTISGPFVDILQALYFSIFGANWKIYILNSSIMNLLFTLAGFFFFKKIGLNNRYSFFYSICVAILANPSMGTPFPDHYSTFFSFIAIVFFFFALETKRKIFWFFIPILFFFAFFSKQTPAAYIIIAFSFNFFLLIAAKKNLHFFTPIIYGSVFSLILLFSFIWIYKVDVNSFFTQYFLYPRSIGLARISDLDLTFNKAISNFKFIHLLLLPLLFIFIKKILKRNCLNDNNFFVTFNIILFSILLIIHQWLTLNFIFIFFLIPILSATIQSNLNKNKFSKFLNFSLILFCLVVTTKYHLRFNEERKMLNLENINLSNYYETGNFAKKLKGLKWITREYSENTKKEIDRLFIFKKNLENEKKKTMLISNYQFFSVILNKSLHSPNRWFGTPVARPSKANPFYEEYVLFNYQIILKNKIEIIYIDSKLGKYPLDLLNEVFTKFPNDCANMNKIEDVLFKFDISSCYY